MKTDRTHLVVNVNKVISTVELEFYTVIELHLETTTLALNFTDRTTGEALRHSFTNLLRHSSCGNRSSLTIDFDPLSVLVKFDRSTGREHNFVLVTQDIFIDLGIRYFRRSEMGLNKLLCSRRQLFDTDYTVIISPGRNDQRNKNGSRNKQNSFFHRYNF